MRLIVLGLSPVPETNPAPIRRKSAKDRKAEIVDTAIRLAAEIGPDRLTTEHLAREIGITQPAIFKHFRTKGEVWQAVAKRISVFLDAGGEAAPAQDLPPPDLVLRLVDRHLGFFTRNPAIPAILFSRELHHENEDLRRHFAQLIANRQAVFAALFRRGVADGVFRRDLDPEAAGALFLSLIQGAAMRWSLAARGFDLQAEGQILARLALDGMRAPA
jgi:AcrR family transcriptional regulator